MDSSMAVWRAAPLAVLLLVMVACAPAAWAAEGEVSALSTGFERTVIIEFTNPGATGVETFKMWLDGGASFKSFKTEKGWTGTRSPEGVLSFTTSSPLGEGQTVKFGIKADRENPGINWGALDGREGHLGGGKSLIGEEPEPPEQVVDPVDPVVISGVLPGSAFRLIPEGPNVGSSVRVTGSGFGAGQTLGLHMDSKSLATFEADEAGSFIITLDIPADTAPGRVTFAVRDGEGNEKTLSIRVDEPPPPPPTTNVGPQEAPLTIEGLPGTLDRGETVRIRGTGDPGSSITATITGPDGEILTTSAADIDDGGRWTYEAIIPPDAPLGNYSAVITDGKSREIRLWTIESGKSIEVIPTRVKFDPGDTMTFNGTASPDQSVEVVLENPQGLEIFSDIIQVGPSGSFWFEFVTTITDSEGTYTLFTTQGTEIETTLIGLGELPGKHLAMRLDRLNYRAGDTAQITIEGTPSSIVTLIVLDENDRERILDPEYKKNNPDEEDKTSEPITLGLDGRATYPLDLAGYASGVYTAVLTRGNDQAGDKFSVGLQKSSHDIFIQTTHPSYVPGAPIIVLGGLRDSEGTVSSKSVLITLELVDPDGRVVKTVESFTDKAGIAENFRVPGDAADGTWTINIESGSFASSTTFLVASSGADGISVSTTWTVESDGSNIVGITGSGATPQFDVTIQIISDDGRIIDTLTAESENTGEFQLTWDAKDVLPGIYNVTASDDAGTAQTKLDLS